LTTATGSVLALVLLLVQVLVLAGAGFCAGRTLQPSASGSSASSIQHPPALQLACADTDHAEERLFCHNAYYYSMFRTLILANLKRTEVRTSLCISV
jgi:hypothetical protein